MLWEITGGIIRVANTYIGKNGRKYGDCEGLLPFSGEPPYTVEDVTNETIHVYDDWLVFERLKRAYHKNGTIVDFCELPQNPENIIESIDTRWPAAQYCGSIRYVFYITENGDFRPYNGVTRIEAKDPEKAVWFARAFKLYTGFWPTEATENFARVYAPNSDSYMTLTGEGFEINHLNSEYMIAPQDMVKLNPKYEGEKEEKIGNINVRYIFNIPLFAYMIYKKRHILFIDINDFESVTDFLEAVEELKKVKIVPGKAPHRAEISPLFYTAWIKLNNKVFEVDIPYGYTLDHVKFVRGKSRFKPSKVYETKGNIARVFSNAPPLVRKGNKYFIGKTEIGPAKDPYDALTKYSQMYFEKVEKKKSRYDKINIITIVLDVDPEYIDEIRILATEENRKKVKEIMDQLNKEYETVIVETNEWGGVARLPRIAMRHVNKITKTVEKYVPVAPVYIWTRSMKIELGTNIFESLFVDNIITSIINKEIDIPEPDSRTRLFELLNEHGVKRLSLNEIESYYLP